MTFIITGANGFIGSCLTKRLIADKNEVYAIDLSFENDNIGESKYVHKIETNVKDIFKHIDKLPTGADSFFHLAWIGVNGPEKADPFIQCDNISIALNCARLASELNCKKFLCAGTIAERAVDSLEQLERVNGGMMYGSAKKCASIMIETLCKTIGLQFVWMQFSNIFGPTNKTGNLVDYALKEILNDKEAKFGPALQPYDFIYVDDLIEAVYRLGTMKTTRSFYFIGSSQPRVLKDYLLEIGDKTNKKELIKIGLRPDDGIKYSFDMFDTSSLEQEIGKYVEKTFSERIGYTIKQYLKK